MRHALMRGLLALFVSLALAGGVDAQLITTGVGVGNGHPPASSGGGSPMSTPFMFTGINSAGPATAAITYNMLMGGENAGTYNATIGNSQALTGVAGTISRLYVNDTTLTAGGYSVCLTVNGSTCSALTCDVTSSATSCSDTAHSVTVATTDLLAWKWCPYNASGCTAGTAPTQGAGGVQIGALFTSTANQESPLARGSRVGARREQHRAELGRAGIVRPLGGDQRHQCLDHHPTQRRGHDRPS